MQFAVQHWVAVLIVALGAFWLGKNKPGLIPFI